MGEGEDAVLREADFVTVGKLEIDLRTRTGAHRCAFLELIAVTHIVPFHGVGFTELHRAFHPLNLRKRRPRVRRQEGNKKRKHAEARLRVFKTGPVPWFYHRSFGNPSNLPL